MAKLIILVNADNVFVAKHREDFKALVERLLRETRYVGLVVNEDEHSMYVKICRGSENKGISHKM